VKAGDLVKHFLTEQIGIVLEHRGDIGVHVLWTTRWQRSRKSAAGNKEWCFEKSLEHLTTA